MSTKYLPEFKSKQEEIIQYAEEIYKATFEANSYFSILKQFDKNIESYHEEIEISSAFYSIVYLSLQNSCMISLSKIYENDKKTVSLPKLLDLCSEAISEFKKITPSNSNSNDDIKTTKFNYPVDTFEKRFFEEELKDEKSSGKLFTFSNDEKTYYTIELEIEKIIDFFKKYNKSNSKILKKLRIQRNKIYAHNDKQGIFRFHDIIEKNPIYYNDIEKLIECAFKITRFIIRILTGSIKPKEYTNIDDWNGTLKYVQLGLKYINKYPKGELI